MNRRQATREIENALTATRDNQELSNKELFTLLFDSVPSFLPFLRDGRTTEAKERRKAVEAFLKAANELIQFFN